MNARLLMYQANLTAINCDLVRMQMHDTRMLAIGEDNCYTEETYIKLSAEARVIMNDIAYDIQRGAVA